MHKYIWKMLWESSSLQSYWILDVWQSIFSELTNNSSSSNETRKTRSGKIIKCCSHPQVEHRITAENIGRDILGHPSVPAQIQVSSKCYKRFLRGFSTWVSNNSKDGDPTASPSPCSTVYISCPTAVPVIQLFLVHLWEVLSLSAYSHPLDRGHQVIP